MIRLVPRDTAPSWLARAGLGRRRASSRWLLAAAAARRRPARRSRGAFGLMAQGAAGSVFALTETLTRATPLIFTGLAAAVAFRARLWNIGAEGQLYAGALAAVAVGGHGGAASSCRPCVLVPLMMLAAARRRRAC